MHGPKSLSHVLIKSLEKCQHIADLSRADSANAVNFYKSLTDGAKGSAKFLIPRHLVVREVIETGSEYLREKVWALPFPVTLFEFAAKVDVCIFALCYTDFTTDNIDYREGTVCYMTPFTLRHNGDLDSPGMTTRIIEGVRGGIEVGDILTQESTISGVDQEASDYACAIASSVVGAVSLLDVKGVEVEVVTPPERLNRRRIRRGKLPLYEHRIIKIGGISKAGHVLGVGSKHASPRMHWRRGHVRTLGSGKKIPIAAMLVNKGGRGFISHDYEVQ
jgi:hypothetical protein